MAFSASLLATKGVRRRDGSPSSRVHGRGDGETGVRAARHTPSARDRRLDRAPARRRAVSHAPLAPLSRRRTRGARGRVTGTLVLWSAEDPALVGWSSTAADGSRAALAVDGTALR